MVSLIVFEIEFVCFAVAIFDLVHDLKAIHCLCQLLTASGNVFRNMRYARETAICNLQFHGNHSYFRKHFQILLAATEGEI